ncbi:MAG: efflux RND transporter periplasmic adaptor subunit, partial [Myxococcota bacterium]|nr:efflux RND transporter periplasmic adaptor subunit [Myxococcota bacterium]
MFFLIPILLGVALAMTGCGGSPTQGELSEAAAESDAPRVGDPADWCAGCGLPESMCTVCSPSLVPKFKAAGDWCAEHGFPESVCPVCNPMRAPDDPVNQHAGEPATTTTSAAAPGTLIRLGSVAIERAAGIETVPATMGSFGLEVSCTARIDFDRNATADVRSPVEGIVRSIAVDLGQEVKAGDGLFTLESADVGDLQARRGASVERVEAARADLERQEALLAEAVTSQRRVELARQEFEGAEAELRAVDQSLRLSGAERGASNGRFTVVAPLSGSIVRRPVLIGTYAGAADSLATVADTSVMWALLDVPEWDAAVVRTGQPVEVQVDGVVGQTFQGEVTWVASEVDPRTRTVTARAEIDNPDGLLRAGQFAHATVQLTLPHDGATVPLDAVQRVGDEEVVFVRIGDGVF